MRTLRLSPVAFRRITLAAIGALGFIIVTGGAVRLTGSGLGCSDWPNCEANQFVAPLEYNAWVEFGNRLFTGVVSVAVILAVLGSLIRVPRRRDLVWLSLGLVAGVLIQIILGAVVVKTDLVPAAVSAHFLVSMALLWNALLLHDRAAAGPGRPTTLVTPLVRTLARVMMGLLVVTLFLGTLVTGSGPHSGDPGEVDRLGFDIREITRAHAFTVVLLIATIVATLVAARLAKAPPPVMQRGSVLLAALVVQAGIGYTQYFLGVPVLLVGLHVLGSVLVFSAAVVFYLSLSRRPDESGAEQPPIEDTTPTEQRELTSI